MEKKVVQVSRLVKGGRRREEEGGGGGGGCTKNYTGVNKRCGISLNRPSQKGTAEQSGEAGLRRCPHGRGPQVWRCKRCRGRWRRSRSRNES